MNFDISFVRKELRIAIKALSLRGLKKMFPSVTTVDDTLQTDKYLVAKCFFDLSEYERAAHCLTSQDNNSNNVLESFLWAYSLYLSGERTKEELSRAPDFEGKLAPQNEHLAELICTLSAQPNRDAYGDWLLGVCLKTHGDLPAAKKYLLSSVSKNAFHWSCWLDLFPLLAPNESLLGVVGDSIPKRFFAVHCALEWESNLANLVRDTKSVLNENMQTFPMSSFQLFQRALVSMSLADYAQANLWVSRARSVDPFRLTNLDAVSHLFFCLGDVVSLSALAQEVSVLNRHQAESCCVLGNYFALKQNHDKAILYFKRALRQNAQYVKAWILLGHEFVEVKNYPSALQAYREAVQVSPHQFQGWYGLGMAYELNQMNLYALYYYQRAAKLRPYDARVWVALGSMFERLGQRREAIKSFLRAEDNEDHEGIALFKLAKLFQLQGEDTKAAVYFKKHLAMRQGEGLLLTLMVPLTASSQPPSQVKQEDMEALKFLARHYAKTSALDLALEYCQNAHRFLSGAHDLEVETLLRELTTAARGESNVVRRLF